MPHLEAWKPKENNLKPTSLEAAEQIVEQVGSWGDFPIFFGEKWQCEGGKWMNMGETNGFNGFNGANGHCDGFIL